MTGLRQTIGCFANLSQNAARVGDPEFRKALIVQRPVDNFPNFARPVPKRLQEPLESLGLLVLGHYFDCPVGPVPNLPLEPMAKPKPQDVHTEADALNCPPNHIAARRHDLF